MPNIKLQKQISTVIFLVLVVWWLIVKIFFSDSFFQNELWSDFYWVMALVGGLIGLVNARFFGWWKSPTGKVLMFFSFGLLCQVFGQISYVYYSLVNNYEVLLPSLGDWGFSATIVLYVFGVIYLGRAIRVRLVRSWRHLGVILAIFILLLGLFSYPMFLDSYNTLKISLEVVILGLVSVVAGAFYLLLAIFNYFFSQEKMMGVFSSEVKFILFALVIHFLSDYMFWYEYGGPWFVAGDASDMLYVVAYFLMTIGIIKLFSCFKNIEVVTGCDCESHNFFKSVGIKL